MVAYRAVLVNHEQCPINELWGPEPVDETCGWPEPMPVHKLLSCPLMLIIVSMVLAWGLIRYMPLPRTFDAKAGASDSLNLEKELWGDVLEMMEVSAWNPQQPSMEWGNHETASKAGNFAGRALHAFWGGEEFSAMH